MNNNTTPLTIVVPIYNVEAYLKQCLDSLVNQTVQNFKVVMVDDGSKDNSGLIAQTYAKNYPEQFLYVYQENAGLGAARNTGMKYCDTPFIEFLDSDDWLLPRTVELVLNRLNKEVENPDIIFMTPVIYDMASCKFGEFMDNERLRNIFFQNITTNPAQSPEMLSLETNINRCVWNFTFLKNNAFAFPEGVKWEDVFPHFYLFHLARRCIMIDNAGFCYRINSGNQITASSDEGRLDIIPVFSKTLVYALENRWSGNEIAYILQMLISFSKWSMSMAQKGVYEKLVTMLHSLMKAIPSRYIKIYIKHFSPAKSEVLLIRILRSSVYGVLSNYHMKECGTQLLQCFYKRQRRN